eukprot:843081_1
MGCIYGHSRTKDDKLEHLLETTALDDVSTDQPSPQHNINASSEDVIPEVSVNTVSNSSAQISAERRCDTLSNASPLANVIENNEIIDASGNVHVNRYYNQTRNANLSITSKMTDLSAAPIYQNTNKVSLDSAMTYNTHLAAHHSTTASLGTNITWDIDDMSQKRFKRSSLTEFQPSIVNSQHYSPFDI